MLFTGVVAPQQRALAGLGASPLVDDVEAEVERFGDVDLEVLEEVLVAVKLDARAVFLEYVVHVAFSFGLWRRW